MERSDPQVTIYAVDPLTAGPGQRGAYSIVSTAAALASGGDIRNIALHAAFLAAEAGDLVRMAHLPSAARREYDKLERALSASETATIAVHSSSVQVTAGARPEAIGPEQIGAQVAQSVYSNMADGEGPPGRTGRSIT